MSYWITSNMESEVRTHEMRFSAPISVGFVLRKWGTSLHIFYNWRLDPGGQDHWLSQVWCVWHIDVSQEEGLKRILESWMPGFMDICVEGILGP